MIPPSLQHMDAAMNDFWAEYKRKQVSCGGVEGHAAIGEIARLDGLPILVEPKLSSANSLNRSENQASPAGKPLSLWARAWRKVAKGIIG